MNSPYVSVIIPVFNDATRLKLCLEALENQTYRKSCYEVIVIDNNSDEDQNIQEVVNQFSQTKITQEPTPGSYAARNKGILLAKGEVIAFTDADCIPAANWLEQGVDQLLNTENCGQVIGKVEIFFADPQNPTPVELFESITAFPQEHLLKKFHSGATANVFTWKYVIDKVGLFNTNLKSHGDLEWGKRVYAQGYRQVYAESVLVQHPARSSLQELYIRTRRLAGGNYDLKLKQAQSPWQRQHVFFLVLLQNLTPPVLFALNTLSDSRLSGIGQKLKVSLVMVLVRCISACEIVRLKCGGKSNRE